MTPSYSRHFALVAVLLLAAVALFAAACGGSDTESTTTSATTSATSGSTGTAAVGANTTSTVPAGETGVLTVKGLMDNPTTLKAEDLEKMTVASITVDDPAVGEKEYRGVRLSDLFATFKLQSTATRLAMTAHANGFVTELSLQDIQWSADAMLAIGEDGTLDVVIPGSDSKMWVKDVVVLEFK